MGEKLPHVEPNDTVSDVIGLMVKHNLEEVPVVQDDQVVGVLSDTLFIERRNLSFSTKIKNVVHKGPSVDEDDSIIDVSELLLSSGYRGVPVTSKSGDYIGFLTRKNLTEVIPQLDELKKTTVKEFMTPSPATIQNHEDITKAKAMMEKYDVRVLPVVDNRGTLLGMVGIKDFMKEGFWPMNARMTRQEKGDRTGERESQEIEAQNIMSEPAITIDPDSTIPEAAEKMIEHDISTLVVTKNDEIRGILTRYDLIELLTSFREKKEVYVQINGVKEGPEVYDHMYDLILGFLEKINKVLKPLVLNVHVVSHRQGGTQRKYSVRLRLSTDHGMLYAKEIDWNMMKALDGALDSLKKRIFQKKEKRLDKRRHPKYQKFKSEN
ncbi:hypothetical protein AKJ56_01720 [candidate division MSBL1 archaeon SCGC-AAA382N08]|uniref:CBS domain-containing protein n=1 Tax=candidate division MSBL1 archaeon SCGC-AAA382N08 TaxID=1698285 RepID=A0A133VP24_9EURY|nr:hypothetical protein AKJ56_01720 [candidate division MSBL1 archaeon SCGC-AAA382N08]